MVEIRSLNSKQLDLTLKVAPLFRDKEAVIRSLITAAVERGKIDVLIYTTSLTGENGQPALTPINKDAFRYYYNEVRSLQAELGINEADITAAVLRIPDVIKVQQDAELSDDEWAMLQSAVKNALADFIAFRTQEGAALEAMFRDKLNGIEALLAEVEPYEKSRVAKIKARLLANLEQLSEQTKQAVDQNRLEAELIYYLEKLDITEEKVRLTNHIKYFRETLAEQGAGVGKKLGFVAQEMGREINTLGSKSNQSEMQIIVVKMKDILEQIKEQVLNVL
ncbi:MAG: YicC family protein [Paludibacteraceae bacterium]|nr:YicC family protein [Paludibacteraceae bacterium]